MGYFKKIDAEQQSEVDRIVRWWRDNHNQIPSYVMSRVLVDEELLNDLVTAYEEQLELLPRRQRPPKNSWAMNHRQAKTFILTMFTLWVVVFALVLLVVFG